MSKTYAKDCELCGAYFTTSNKNALLCSRCALMSKILHIVRKHVLLPFIYVLYDLGHPSEVVADWRKAKA